MSFGKMNTAIQLTREESSYVPGLGYESTTVTVANVRTYREGRHGSEVWANRAVWSQATDLFRFRVIPGVEVNTSMKIICEGKTYEITSVEDVKGKGMYIEALAKTVNASS